jgi:ribonucleoside-triphosphate reductase
LHRFKIQSAKKVFNYPFLMGEGIWLDSGELDWEDPIGEVLRHGTLTIGFIGLAEALKTLVGKHHGESAEAQELGLKTIGHMRRRADEKSAETGLNFSLIATPAEGLSGRFVALDRRRYGELEGVTDREYYTNSFHIPVYFPIPAFRKIQLEAPYHAMTNGGHITYVELDGDTSKNPEAFEAIIRYMQAQGVGYGSINHPLDRDPVCGYLGVIGDICPRCGRREGEGVSVEALRELRRKFHDVPNWDAR